MAAGAADLHRAAADGGHRRLLAALRAALLPPTRAAISLVNATLQENISGMRVIQSMAREDRNSAEFDDLNAYNRDTNLEASRVAALVLPLVEVVAALAIALVDRLWRLADLAGRPPDRRAGGVHPVYQPLLRSDSRPEPAIYAVAARRRRGGAHLPDPRRAGGDQSMRPMRRCCRRSGARSSSAMWSLATQPSAIVLHDLNLRIPPGRRWPSSGRPARARAPSPGCSTRFYDVQGGRGAGRWLRREAVTQALAAQPDRRRAARAVSLHRHDPREHPLRSA